MVGEYAVELKNVTKRFPGVVALHNMQLQIRPGEIHGLIGENGAGKSTLIKVLTGVHMADEGEIFVNGEKKVFRNPNESAHAGIACVYQELNIEKLLSVTDNIFINKWKKKGLLLDYDAMHQQAAEVKKSLGQDIDPRKAAGTFGMGVQQMIEIAKAVLVDARVIIMDEPTSSLGEKEVEQLMKTCRELKSRGISILFVSHKLEELFELCDRVTVMRDGEYIDTRDIQDWTNDSLITAMVGRTLENQYPKEQGVRGECMLKVEHLSVGGVLHDVNFEAYGGEILGFAGLVGAGRSEVMRAIFGLEPADSGEIHIEGKKVTIRDTTDAFAKGIGMVTEDRRGEGIIPAASVKENASIASIRKYLKGFLIDDKAELAAAKASVDSMNAKYATMDQQIRNLSGGNQQKVILSRLMLMDLEVLILDEPTRGIDVGAKKEIHELMCKFAAKGYGVIMISSEMPEVLGMSDRIIVMHEGRKTGELLREEASQEAVMRLAVASESTT